ncbi:type II and III secretion system protein [Verrucomicrobiaceae bacterium R5-34]|uniref:Type II and III secretion system protein n=1 Tax=Oceaniferula flava TaxID=2800421 RepID=A0AAE2S8U8_9BACT|nr:Amuc_1098 family type IV pilus outer membrane protein [Oceaniferula flavus]MBK1829395.1 type II and III secretion system protein [Verrucomicrobiaceae bacterium R5-34]MBK1853623.1 type II and III secretion system protein [Oceaniferula flavus]MBM1134928.1 type II and III secretion system protein [Oceaniferula flavus]
METTPTHQPTHTTLLAGNSDRGHSVLRHVSRKAAILMAVAAAMPVAIEVAHAQSSIASGEIARRSQLVVEADKALLLGRKAYAENDYEEAVKQYQQAVSLLPPGPALADRRHSYTGHLGDATVALAQKYRRVGKYNEARTMLEGVLAKDPANFAAKKQLEYLDDPIRTNPALDYQHTQNVDRVRKALYMGEGYFNLGNFDAAENEFKKVLQVDKYNTAARRWLEKIASKKSDYYRSAYDHTRAQLLSEVDRAWEMAVPPELPTARPDETPEGPAYGVQYIKQKLNNIIIPVVDFDNTTVEEALDFLRLRARELDPEPDEGRKGINFIVRKPRTDGAAAGGEADLAADAGAAAPNPANLRIKELKLRQVPLGTVLQYICDATRLRYKLDEHSVVLLPLDALEVSDLYTRSFTVPPDFISKLSGAEGGGDGGADPDPFGGGADTGGGDALKARAGAKELLLRNGVSFPDNAFANHIAATSTLLVHNTLGNLDIIEQIINNMRQGGPRQVRIMTKFIEVSQENSDELGFDWILNPVSLNGSSSFLSGGSTGNGSARSIADLGDPSILGTGATSVSNIATSGLRSGDYATTRNSIDSILNNPDRTAQTSSVAPGILSFTGLFTDGEVQMIMRGLAQKKGTDVMTAPSVLARSGEKATIEVIREFIYPTEYEPPELPNSVGVGTGDSDTGTSAAIFPVTPATPTAFETRNTGVTLEIEPTIGENNYTIDLRFAPELVEFEGFINYGSPIQSPSTDALGNPISITITENRIEMPVFSTRRVTTALTIYDGYTVAVGGLMSEDVQNVQDKVPILGDLPIIGRLFQSKSESRIKSNLIIFVTAQIIDAAGSPINNTAAPSAAGTGGAAGAPADGPGLLPTP